MGIRPYAADCGALVLPIASKVKLRTPSDGSEQVCASAICSLCCRLTAYDFQCIRLRSLGCARDDTETIFQQRSLAGFGMMGDALLGKLGRRQGIFAQPRRGKGGVAVMEKQFKNSKKQFRNSKKAPKGAFSRGGLRRSAQTASERTAVHAALRQSSYLL